MAHPDVAPPTIEYMLNIFVKWMAYHARAKITVRIDYVDGTHQTTELDYRREERRWG